ncbi:EAL domain-containing protein [Arthrobacter sp. OV608]|uniref:sensor domain-containing phosphodiesterase n=1 Tax=Arthrobacter sp. OV608 TaxID=1882768 RepID=UPI00148075B7|nr:EAL domain-containing protein [Arthrobacter sp. OV608]
MTVPDGLAPWSWPFMSRWWMLYSCSLAGVVLALALPAVVIREPWGMGVLAVGVLLVAGYLVWALLRRQSRARSNASRTSRLLGAVLATSREWLWTIGPDGRFTFSGPMARELIGYEPSEIVGRHFSHFIEPHDLAQALQNRASLEAPDASWSGLVTVCRHRDGGRVLVEVSGRPILDGQGQVCGFEGTTRALDVPEATAVAAEEARAGVAAMLTSRTLLTAFQPIRALDTGRVIGAEALTRFLSAEDPGISPEAWFVEAASVGLGVDLEIVALQSALSAAASLPEDLYVAVNLSPRACLDSRVTGVLQTCGLPLGRIVLELTEHHEVTDYGQLGEALTPLRCGGLKVAIDDAGAGFASMRHIVELKPELIKLDREVIAGINADAGLRALGAAMVGFAAEIGASLIAEGIETEAELATVRDLGMTAAQGYMLGRPTVAVEEWNRWSGLGANNTPSSQSREQPNLP